MDRLSFYASKQEPFLFVIDYKQNDIFVKPLREVRNIYFQTPILNNFPRFTHSIPSITSINPLPFDRYKKAFDLVQQEIKKGNTYLLNLTFPTSITINGSLLDIFYSTKALFKLYYKGNFVCFSPERFVRIENDTIRTFPMKGTIDATLPNAKEKILNDEKEMAEHTMVVDLLRNDLNMVATNVRVKRFRYIDKIISQGKKLLQVSSEIEGKLPKDWQKNLGEIFFKLLPAGSVTGTPKRSTCSIIDRIEGYDRGFYTGVFGVFDGKILDSAVMIRFIEKNGSSYLYKSGGGITIQSNVKKEYQELIDKIYLPF